MTIRSVVAAFAVCALGLPVFAEIPSKIDPLLQQAIDGPFAPGESVRVLIVMIMPAIDPGRDLPQTRLRDFQATAQAVLDFLASEGKEPVKLLPMSGGIVADLTPVQIVQVGLISGVDRVLPDGLMRPAHAAQP